MVVVSLDMFLNSTQDIFVKSKNDKLCLVKGNVNSGKTIATIFKLLYLKRNYCFELNDKILFLCSDDNVLQVVDIFNYINKSDLYKSILPSDNIEVHILTFNELIKLDGKIKYTHIIIDDIEIYKKEHIIRVFSMFNKLPYSKVYLIQNSMDSFQNVDSIVEYLRRIISTRETYYKFRYVIDDEDRDEFTQIDITPDIKYSNYEYRNYVDFDTKESFGYYTDYISIYKDMGTFLYDLSSKGKDICLVDRDLRIINRIKILGEWVRYNTDLYFVQLDDEGMGRCDLFRGDIVLINASCEIHDLDVVVILKDGHLYARRYFNEGVNVKFISEEIIFSDIYLDDDVKILGKVVGYIRRFNNY